MPMRSVKAIHRGQETERQRVTSVEDNRSLSSERASRGRERSAWEQFDRVKNELEGVGKYLDWCLKDLQVLHEDYCDLRGSQKLAFRDYQEDLGSLRSQLRDLQAKNEGLREALYGVVWTDFVRVEIRVAHLQAARATSAKVARG
jgi:hypothetical protein